MVRFCCSGSPRRSLPALLRRSRLTVACAARQVLSSSGAGSAQQRWEGPMRQSTDRILTSHVGSLPRSPELYARLQAKEAGENPDGTLEADIAASVADI